MKKKVLLLVSLICGMSIITGFNLAAGQEQSRDMTQSQKQDKAMTQAQKGEYIYGSQLMTEKERAAYRNRLRAAKTEEERQQIRQEHHRQMQERAMDQGVKLPAEPPERGMMKGGGMGYGGGRGQGMGGGMGRGGGRGR